MTELDRVGNSDSEGFHRFCKSANARSACR